MPHTKQQVFIDKFPQLSPWESEINAYLTVIWIFIVFLPDFTVIVALPFFFTVTTPLELIVAVPVFFATSFPFCK